jgi:hypothetical protein
VLSTDLSLVCHILVLVERRKHGCVGAVSSSGDRAPHTSEGFVTLPDDVTARVGQVPFDVGVTGRRADRVKRIVALLMLNNFSVVSFLGAHRKHRVSPPTCKVP